MDLQAVYKQLTLWKAVNGDEFIRYNGHALMEQVQLMQQTPFSYAPLLLPSSHPDQVIEKGTPFRAGEENLYFVNFINPIAPWSHTEIVSAHNADIVGDLSFVTPPGLYAHLFDAYFNDRGQIIKDIQPELFDEKHRSFVDDVGFHIIDPWIQQGRPAGVLNPRNFEQILEEKKAASLYVLLKKGFLDERDCLKKEYLCQNSPLWPLIRRVFGSGMFNDPSYAEFAIAVLATPTPRPFSPTSLMRRPADLILSKRIGTFLSDEHLLTEKKLIKADWETRLNLDRLPEDLKPYREWIIFRMIQLGSIGENIDREYFGIGADENNLDTYSNSIDGVRISDSRLAKRMKELIRKRRKDIQRIMSVPAAIVPAFQSFEGEMSKWMIRDSEKIRHVRQALIDNLLTHLNPRSYVYDTERTRYRLELVESGSQIYERWTEDPHGQFCKKKPIESSTNLEQDAEEYVQNHYVLSADGSLQSFRSLDKEKLLTHERGNTIFKADGTLGWQKDADRGQYFKRKDADPSTAEKDVRDLVPVRHFEGELSDGESEWCASYAIRMMQSAYMHTYMPEFSSIQEQLEKDFQSAAGLSDASSFDKHHSKILFHLADQYAKRILHSEMGERYFRNMCPSAQINSRVTPDMMMEFFTEKAPGIVSTLVRGAKTMCLPRDRKYAQYDGSETASHSAGVAGVGVFGAPTAAMKFGFNLAAATIGLIPDLIACPIHDASNEEVRVERARESGIDRSHAWSVLAGVKAFGKRLFWDYIPFHLMEDAADAIMPSAEPNAFA